jgi:hypothetical protein
MEARASASANEPHDLQSVAGLNARLTPNYLADNFPVALDGHPRWRNSQEPQQLVHCERLRHTSDLAVYHNSDGRAG